MKVIKYFFLFKDKSSEKMNIQSMCFKIDKARAYITLKLPLP